MRRERAARARGHARRHRARAAARDRPAGSLLRRRRGAERRRQRAHPRGIRLRARVRAARAGRRRLRARRGALRRPHLLRQPRSRRARSSVLGTGGRWRGSGAAAREDGQPSRSSTSGAARAIADDLAAGRIVGWMDGACEFGPRALGHRSILAAPHAAGDARPAQSRHQVSRGVPAVRAGGARRSGDRYFELPPAARGWRASCRACFRSGRSGAPRSRRSRTSTDGARAGARARHGAAAARAARGVRRRSGIPVLLNTSFNVAGEPIVNRALEGYSTFRRCGIDVLVAGRTRRHQARRAWAGAEGGRRMIKKRGGMRRRLIVLGSTRRIDRRSRRGLWRSDSASAG
jgi:hypothetical protein